MKIRKLRVQNMIDPLGIDTEHPLFSYLLEAEEKNQTQTACQILAASGEELLKRNIGDLCPECWQEDTGICGTGSQASYGCALFSGLIPEKKRETAVERLVQAVEKKDFHLTSGEVGLKQVFRTLGEYGRSDVVWKMVMNRTEPSYRVFVDRGLTTLPEYWNYEELWYGMARSRNHAMMGHVKEWIMNDLLGIHLAAPGGSVVILQPYVPREIQEMHGKLLCSYGEISLSCQVKRRTEQVQVSLEITLPVGVKGILKEPYVDGNRQEQSVREKELGSGTWKEEFVFSS